MSALLFPGQKRNRFFISSLLLLSMFICLTGCGNGNEAGTQTTGTTGTSAVTEEAAGELTGNAPAGDTPAEEATAEPDIPEIDFDKLPEINSYDPGIPYIDTMGFGMEPLGPEDYTAESAEDFSSFENDGKIDYIAFKWITVEKAYDNTKDMDCQCMVDLKFRDGSLVQGVRCNYITELKEGRKFRYGYVMDDSTVEDGEDRIYLYLLQE